MTLFIATVGLAHTCALVAISVVISLVFALVGTLAYHFLNGAPLPDKMARLAGEFFVIAAPFGVVGIVAGYLTGISRSSAVYALVPGFLTLFSGLTAYLMSQGVRMAMLSGLAVAAFATTLLLGVIVGSLERQEFDASQTSLEQRLVELEKEHAIYLARKGLGLPIPKPGDGPETPKK